MLGLRLPPSRHGILSLCTPLLPLGALPANQQNSTHPSFAGDQRANPSENFNIHSLPESTRPTLRPVRPAQHPSPARLPARFQPSLTIRITAQVGRRKPPTHRHDATIPHPTPPPYVRFLRRFPRRRCSDFGAESAVGGALPQVLKNDDSRSASSVSDGSASKRRREQRAGALWSLTVIAIPRNKLHISLFLRCWSWDPSIASSSSETMKACSQVAVELEMRSLQSRQLDKV
ncbi:hypothetical protein U9M48_013427 [Paspalum notatum var. saurae]|uniref:Uncharacterized protein n=1 Tax=Paspalum notatum var. saurae TaxID=547442 RepID=A0AAQ3T1P9_PASNO